MIEEKVADAVKASGIEDKVKHKKLKHLGAAEGALKTYRKEISN